MTLSQRADPPGLQPWVSGAWTVQPLVSEGSSERQYIPEEATV